MLFKLYKKISFFLIIFLLVQFIILPIISYSNPEELIGKNAPDFTLESIFGKTISLKDFQGKIILLDFFATWCGPCRMEMQHLKKVYDEYKEKDFIIISIDLYEDAEKVKDFVNENGIEWIVVIDKDGVATRNYLIEAIPTLFLIDKNGIVRFVNVGVIDDNSLRNDIVKLYEITQTKDKSTVEACLYPKTVEIRAGEQLMLNILISTGGSKVQAGEFLFSFDNKYLQLVNVTKESPWELNKIDYGKYVFYRLSKEAISEPTKIATLIFKVKEDIEITQTEVLLQYLKAADANGNDLPITITGNTSLIHIIHYTAITSYTIEWTPPKKTVETQLTTTIVIVLDQTRFILFTIPLIVAFISIISLYVYSSKKKISKYSLILPNNQIITSSSPDKMYGREDFEKYLKIDELKYITRRDKGGQFRIIAKKINRMYDYYIIDEYSTNSTLVNDVVIKGKGYIKLKNGDIIKLPIHTGYLNIIFRSF
jgi:thiol-disulfide isomerase/thioredoxin